MELLKKAAILVAMVCAAVLTVVVSLNLRYKPLAIEGGPGAYRSFGYVDTWSGTIGVCRPKGQMMDCVVGRAPLD